MVSEERVKELLLRAEQRIVELNRRSDYNPFFRAEEMVGYSVVFMGYIVIVIVAYMIVTVFRPLFAELKLYLGLTAFLLLSNVASLVFLPSYVRLAREVYCCMRNYMLDVWHMLSVAWLANPTPLPLREEDIPHVVKTVREVGERIDDKRSILYLRDGRGEVRAAIYVTSELCGIVALVRPLPLLPLIPGFKGLASSCHPALIFYVRDLKGYKLIKRYLELARPS